MLDLLDLKFDIDKDEYKKKVDTLNARLSELQRACKTADIPILIVFEGWEAAGKGTCANRLLVPLDPRGIKVFSIKEPTPDERYHPYLWRFWLKIPAKGQIVILDASWYHDIIVRLAISESNPQERRYTLEAITQFERQLVERGMVVAKFWFHISQKEQKRRFDALLSDPATAWRVTDEGRHQQRHYSEYLSVVESVLTSTDSPETPWTLVEANHKRAAHLKVLATLVKTLESALDGRMTAADPVIDPMLDSPSQSHVLARVDLGRHIGQKEYDSRRKKAQQKLRRLQHEVYRRRIPVIAAFEGWDAAGKGGAIKRLTSELDPRGYEVISISAPTTEERAYPYWWRFWRRIPKDGHFGIFDRTWYGRVLVERIEGFCTAEEWQRAYGEINEFEAQLVHHGSAVVKFWLHIDPDEQLKRFNERMNNPAKHWKITDEDWRNREKWLLYETALEDMFKKTSTALVPWTVVEANDKLFARVKVLETVCLALERRLDEQ